MSTFQGKLMNFYDNINLFNSLRFKDRTIFYGVVLQELSIADKMCDTPEATKHQGIRKSFYQMQMIASLRLLNTLK